MEAEPGIEPRCTDLQSAEVPLGIKYFGAILFRTNRAKTPHTDQVLREWRGTLIAPQKRLAEASQEVPHLEPNQRRVLVAFFLGGGVSTTSTAWPAR